jgi:light-regulated signal transduction histidine kinase (bacteriophytochrome)
VVAVLVLAFCAVLGAVLTSRLQRLISEPILACTEFARAIARSRDYSLRVPVQRADEVGMLSASFNEMLEQIESRDIELQAARTLLERRVEERTRALQHQTEELTRSNADLEQFAYVASHDLQEPLRMVASYTQLLAETSRDKLDRDARQFIDYAVDGALRMQRLISDLLAYSRLGRGDIRMTDLELDDVMTQATKNLEVALAESGARIVCDRLPTVRGNASQLTQLFQNLIGNAIKFRGAEPPEVEVRVRQTDGAYELAVRDNGIGFDPKYAAKIFVIFQRLHARGRYPGTGIGLAVCKKIVEHHGGRIWVESAPGRGTTFFFTVPDAPIDIVTPTKEEHHERTDA